MEPMAVDEIIQLAKPANGFSLCDTPVVGVSIDSRTIKRGELFVAVRGNRTDGHNYIQEAIDKGASGIVAETAFNVNDVRTRNRKVNFFVVKDSLEFLGNMARLYLKKLGVKTISVTGTSGKTSVKDFIVQILSKNYFAAGSKGNYNNLYGLPLSIFDLNCWTEVAVLEMGMSAPGEISRLCEIAQPDIGVLNNIGYAHIETLGSIGNIARAKSEMVEFISKKGGVVVINYDDERVVNLSKGLDCKYIKVGTASECDFRISNISVDNNANPSFKLNGRAVKLNIPGIFSIYNSAMALAASVTYGIEFEVALEELPKLRLPEMRSSVYNLGGVTVIDDCYNANPQSTGEAVRVLSSLRANRRFMVFGDMLELGVLADSLHREVGERIGKSNVDCLLTYGNLAELSGARAQEFNGNIEVVHCGDYEEIARILSQKMGKGDAVLFKGSRGMKLEKALELFTEFIKGK